MKRKTVLGMITAIVITAGMLAGCGDKDTNDLEEENVTAQDYDDSEYAPDEEDMEFEEYDDEFDQFTDESDESGEETVAENAEDDGAASDNKSDEAVSDKKIDGEFAGFKVYDLLQEEMTLGSLISKNKVTMLNFWGTFCGPCINEMPDLADIERKYKDKGFEIIGVTVDAIDYDDGSISPEIINDAMGIVEDTNVEYPIVVASPELIKFMQLDAVPVTILVNENGDRISDPILGSKSREDWEKVISDLLK